MTCSLIHTQPGDNNFSLFEKLPAQLYPSDSIRLKQSDSINNEFLHICTVAVKNNEPLGRLALYFNPKLKYDNKSTACIGNYECVNDHNVSGQLLSSACSIAKQNGFSYMIGPMNGSTWDNYRFSVHHHHPNFFLEPYHHLYYNHQFKNSGFRQVTRYISLIDRKMDYESAGGKVREQELLGKGVTFRNISIDDYEEDIRKIYEFSYKAFRSNFLYTPIPWEVFRSKYLPLKSFIDPSYVIIAEDGGRVAGFVFCIEDLYAGKTQLILKTLARDMDKKYKGLGNVLSYLVTKAAKEKGLKSVIHAMMIDTNFSTSLSEAYSGEPYSEYALYGKEI